MKQILQAYAQYDLWANQKILALVLELSSAQQDQHINSSFSSIHKTCAHIWDASRIWWERLQLVAFSGGPTVDANIPMENIIGKLLEQDQQWIDWIQASSEDELTSVLHYQNRKGDSFAQPIHEILLHLFNHGTYHRGQLVTMLRQLGVDQIPQTDYIVFSRNNISKPI